VKIEVSLVINHIIFDFYNINFLIKQIVKVDVEVKCDKYLRMEGVCCLLMEQR
jgi:hypothetical protein